MPYTPQNKVRIVTAASLFDGHDAAMFVFAVNVAVVQIRCGHRDLSIFPGTADGCSADLHAVDSHAVDSHAVDPHAVDPHAVDSHAVDPHAVHLAAIVQI